MMLFVCSCRSRPQPLLRPRWLPLGRRMFVILVTCSGHALPSCMKCMSCSSPTSMLAPSRPAQLLKHNCRVTCFEQTVCTAFNRSPYGSTSYQQMPQCRKSTWQAVLQEMTAVCRASSCHLLRQHHVLLQQMTWQGSRRCLILALLLMPWQRCPGNKR